MARIITPTVEQEQGWQEWVASRPPQVRDIARRFDPWTLYMLKSTGQLVTLRSFEFDETSDRVTLKVEANGETAGDKILSGINPDDLSAPNAAYSEEDASPPLLDEDEIDAQIESFRDAIRRSGPSV